MSESFTKEAYQIIYKHPTWKEKAKNYEENLAVKLFHNSYTKAAVKTALGKISRILTAYYGTQGQPLTEEQRQTVQAAGAITDLGEQALDVSGNNIQVNKTLVRALMQGRRDNTGAGQVKKLEAGDLKEDGTTYTAEEAEQENEQTLNAVINGNGNLREQMTLLYNGMFINGGTKKAEIAQGVSLKGVLQGVKRPAANQPASALSEINYDLLEGLDSYKSGEDVFSTYSLARDLEKRNEELQGKGNWFTRWWRGFKRGWNAAFSNTFNRSKRKNGKGLGLAHYQRLGIAPSARERAFSVEKGENGQEQLKWKEGEAYFEANEEITAEGLRHTAGVSGTTLRMLGAYRLMGASQKELLDFRLALIAWMVSSHDHSLYEILKGSHNAGVKGSEDISEAAVMYMNVDPLDTDILRKNFTEDGQFPHEVVFKEKLNELRDAREEKALELIEGREEALRERADSEEAAKDKRGRLNQKKIEKNDLYKKIKAITTKINNAAKVYAKDTDGSRRRRDEENLALFQGQMQQLQQELAELEADVRSAEQRARDAYDNAPDKLFYTSDRAALNNKDATKLVAHDLALNIYTTGAYLSMNLGKKWTSLVSLIALIGKRADREKFGTYEGSYRAESWSLGLVSQVHDMVRLAARMAEEALEERGAVLSTNNNDAGYLHAAEINTYRGEKNSGSSYSQAGSTYETEAFTSTSKSFDKALMYFGKSIENASYDKAVFAIYKMNGKGSVDVSALSKVPDEKEVLVQPGTGFIVETPLVRNVSVEALRSNPNHIVEDKSVTKEQLREEVQLNDQGKVNERNIRHVNVVKLVEQYGPAEKRRARYAGREDVKEQISNSFRRRGR